MTEQAGLRHATREARITGQSVPFNRSCQPDRQFTRALGAPNRKCGRVFTRAASLAVCVGCADSPRQPGTHRTRVPSGLCRVSRVCRLSSSSSKELRGGVAQRARRTCALVCVRYVSDGAAECVTAYLTRCRINPTHSGSVRMLPAPLCPARCRATLARSLGGDVWADQRQSSGTSAPTKVASATGSECASFVPVVAVTTLKKSSA
jgi:hypothetical protein